MEREMVGVYGLVALFFLIMLRIPVALAMLITGIVGTFVLSLASPFIKFGPYLLQFKTALWNSVANYDLSVVPLFILMGFLAAETGLSRDLFQGLSALTRKIKGGVAMATILACAGFGAVSGSSIATASTMSRVALPQLRRLKYDEGLATPADRAQPSTCPRFGTDGHARRLIRDPPFDTRRRDLWRNHSGTWIGAIYADTCGGGGCVSDPCVRGHPAPILRRWADVAALAQRLTGNRENRVDDLFHPILAVSWNRSR